MAISSSFFGKWREKDKTTVGCVVFEVLKPRFWEWNRVPVSRGSETQVLRVKPSVRLSRSWNPGSQSQIPRSWNPMSWEPNAATRACTHGRIVSDRHGYPLVKFKNQVCGCVIVFSFFIWKNIRHSCRMGKEKSLCFIFSNEWWRKKFQKSNISGFFLFNDTKGMCFFTFFNPFDF
jgi:hypothetical protein